MPVNLDVEQVKKLHHQGQAMKIHGNLNNGLLKAAVFGANDGIVTTFAVVAGVAGAGLSPVVILVMGVANLVADGISMGMGDYLGERSEQKHKRRQLEIERWEVENIPVEERTELCESFMSRGVNKADAKQLADTIVKYPDLWVEMGYVDEMGVRPDFDKGLWKTGVMTFIAFMIAGSLPLLPYFLQNFGVPIPSEHQFSLSIISTASTLFFVGSLRTLITKGRWWMNGLEMLLIGAVAAGSAYFVGAGIETMIK